MFSVIAKHFGATAATVVTTFRKALTVIISFVAFPADKPLNGYFMHGVAFFLLSIIVESHKLSQACSNCFIQDDTQCEEISPVGEIRSNGRNMTH